MKTIESTSESYEACNCIDGKIKLLNEDVRTYLAKVYYECNISKKCSMDISLSGFEDMVAKKAAEFERFQMPITIQTLTKIVLADLGIVPDNFYRAKVVSYRDGDILKIPRSAKYIRFYGYNDLEEDKSVKCIATWLEPVEEGL